MPDQPDIVIQEEAIMQPYAPSQPSPQPVHADISKLKEENRTFAITAFILSILSLLLVGIAFFLKIDPLFLFGVGIAVLGIVLSVYAQAKKKPGEKYAFAALILSGLALLSAILIFVSSIVVLPS